MKRFWVLLVPSVCAWFAARMADTVGSGVEHWFWVFMSVYWFSMLALCTAGLLTDEEKGQ